MEAERTSKRIYNACKGDLKSVLNVLNINFGFLDDFLQYAQTQDRTDIIVELLQLGAIPRTELIRNACQKNQLDVIQTIIHTASHIDAIMYQCAKYAAEYGQLDIIKMLVKNNITLDSALLFAACCRKKYDVVKYLAAIFEPDPCYLGGMIFYDAWDVESAIILLDNKHILPININKIHIQSLLNHGYKNIVCVNNRQKRLVKTITNTRKHRIHNTKACLEKIIHDRLRVIDWDNNVTNIITDYIEY